MKELKFRVWHKKENKMYYRGYQKLLHVLLCEDDEGSNDGRGRPVKRASYEDCEFFESTSFADKNRREIYEGDIVRFDYQGKTYEGSVDYVPDMFGSKSATSFPVPQPRMAIRPGGGGESPINSDTNGGAGCPSSQPGGTSLW